MHPREEFHLETLRAFVDLHEFSDLNLVQALRFVKSEKTQREGGWMDRQVDRYS